MSSDKKSRKAMTEAAKERLGLDYDLAASALWSDLIDNADLFSNFKHGEDDPEDVLKALENWLYTRRWILEEFKDEITGKQNCDQVGEQLENIKHQMEGKSDLDESPKADYETYNGVHAGLSLLTEILEGLRHGEESVFTKKLAEKPPNRPKDVRAISHLKIDIGKGYRFLMMCGTTQPEATEALNSVLIEEGLPIMTVDAIRKLAPKAENLHSNVGTIERFGFKPKGEENTGIWPLPEIGEEREKTIKMIASFSLLLSVSDAKKHYGK